MPPPDERGAPAPTPSARAPAARAVLRFLAVLVLVYGVLVIAPVDAVYRPVLRTTSNIALGLPFALATGVDVTFSPFARGDDLRDTKILLTPENGGDPALIPFNTRGKAYLPLALLAALVLATPIPWRRRGRALAWGLLLFHVVLWLRLLLLLLSTASQTETLASVSFGATTDAVLLLATKALYRSYLISFAVPLVLWVALCFRREDLERLGAWQAA